MKIKRLIPGLLSILRIVSLVSALTVTALTLLGQLPAPTAQISGMVTDEAGNPLPGVLVTYALAPDPTVTQSPFFYSGTATDSTGAFSSEVLPAGTYLLCTKAVPALSLVENCEWTLFPPSVTLADSQAVTGVKLVMTKGVSFTIRVNDPTGTLANPLTAKVGALLITELLDDHGFVHAVPRRSSDSGGQDLSLALPFGRQYRLSLAGQNSSGQNLGIADAGGKNVGAPIIFQTVQTVPLIQYQFTVSATPVITVP